MLFCLALRVDGPANSVSLRTCRLPQTTVVAAGRTWSEGSKKGPTQTVRKQPSRLGVQASRVLLVQRKVRSCETRIVVQNTSGRPTTCQAKKTSSDRGWVICGPSLQRPLWRLPWGSGASAPTPDRVAGPSGRARRPNSICDQSTWRRNSMGTHAHFSRHGGSRPSPCRSRYKAYFARKGGRKGAWVDLAAEAANVTASDTAIALMARGCGGPVALRNLWPHSLGGEACASSGATTGPSTSKRLQHQRTACSNRGGKPQLDSVQPRPAELRRPLAAAAVAGADGGRGRAVSATKSQIAMQKIEILLAYGLALPCCGSTYRQGPRAFQLSSHWRDSGRLGQKTPRFRQHIRFLFSCDRC